MDRNYFLDCLLSQKKGLYLFKLHGSVGWRKHNRQPTSIVKVAAEERHENSVLIYPTEVKSISSPFDELYESFKRLLGSTEQLIIIGCSLRDDILKDLISKASTKNPKLIIHLCDPAAKELQKNMSLPNCKIHEVEFGTDEFSGSVIPKIAGHDLATTAVRTTKGSKAKHRS